MSSFSSTASLQSCWATRRHRHMWFSPTGLWPVSWFFSLLAFPTQWQLSCQRTPCLALGVNSVLLREGGSRHRPVLQLHPEHPSVLHSHPQESRVADAQRKGPQGHWSFLLHLLDAQSLNVLWKPLLRRTDTTMLITKECGFAHPQVLLMALAPCGPSLMPCSVASWSGPVAPWCFCTDTARGRSISTPPAKHHRCTLETRATHTIPMLVLTFVIVYILNSIFSFHTASFSNIHLWLIQTSQVLVSCFPTFSPFLLILRDPRFPRFCSHVRSHGWSANV